MGRGSGWWCGSLSNEDPVEKGLLGEEHARSNVKLPAPPPPARLEALSFTQT